MRSLMPPFYVFIVDRMDSVCVYMYSFNMGYRINLDFKTSTLVLCAFQIQYIHKKNMTVKIHPHQYMCAGLWHICMLDKNVVTVYITYKDKQHRTYKHQRTARLNPERPVRESSPVID